MTLSVKLGSKRCVAMIRDIFVIVRRCESMLREYSDRSEMQLTRLLYY